MPSCEAVLHFSLSVSDEWNQSLRCVQSPEHDGQHETHIWTDAPNKLNPDGKGLVKIINW